MVKILETSIKFRRRNVLSMERRVHIYRNHFIILYGLVEVPG